MRKMSKASGCFETAETISINRNLRHVNQMHNLCLEKSPTFLVVHVDSRRRGTTPAAAGGIAEKGRDRPRRRCALKLATVAGLASCCNLSRG